MRQRFARWMWLALFALPLDAQAALTDSEKAQIVGFVKGGDAKLAGRVRALVARPDLTDAEAAEPLIAAYRDTPFDAARAELTRALLFGPGSEPSRSTLTGAVVEALLARADRALGALPASEDELVRLHAFVAEHVAGGEKIRDDAKKRAALSYRKHIEANAKWLRYGSSVAPEGVRVRAQVALCAIELAKNAFSKNDVSGWLGLGGARQRAFLAHGVLIEDGGGAPEARLELVVRLLEATPKDARPSGLWSIHKTPTAGLFARAPITRAGTPLSASPKKSEARYFGGEVTPLLADREIAEVAFSLALTAARTVLAKNAELAGIAERLAADSASAGPDAYLAGDLVETRIGPEGMAAGAQGASGVLLTAHSVRLVLLDAPRAITVAALRAHAGRGEPAAQLALALGVLASGSDATELAVGRSADDGALTIGKLSELKRAGQLVTSFVLDGARYDLGVSADGRVSQLRIDGKEPKLSGLALARLVPRAGEKWTTSGVEWTRLTGAPLGLAVDEGRLLIAAPKNSGGFDALVGGRAAVDASVRATLKPSGAGGGLLLRARAGEGSYDGIALFVSAEPARAELVWVDGQGRAIELAPPVELPPAKPEGWAVTFSVTGQQVSASVGGKKITAKLDRAAASGKIGLVARRGGRIEVQSVTGSSLPPRTGKTK